MSDAPAPWTWSVVPVAPRSPHAMLVVFSRGPLAPAEDVPLSRARFGFASSADAEALDVRTIARGADPAWFDGWRSGAMRSIATTDLGDDLAALDAADHLHLVIATPQAPPDLGYLQATWALARWMAARGATTVLDVHAHTFLPAAALPAAGAPFDARREVRTVFETDSTRPDGAHALHTRGLRKLGAPDLVALCSEADAALVADVISQLTHAVATGTDLAARHGVELSPTTTWYVVDDRDDLANLLQLNNAARVLVDDHGRHLLGVLARIGAGAS